ncbi:MAG TPA: RnfH family protein [Gammaproteobacteria bacterium]
MARSVPGERAASAGGQPQAADVEVVYVTRTEQRIARVPWEPGLTAGAAAERSGLLARYVEAHGREPLLGVFGTPVTRERLVAPGDRVELCRPLVADPRDRRRELSARGGVMGGRFSLGPARKEPA